MKQHFTIGAILVCSLTHGQLSIGLRGGYVSAKWSLPYANQIAFVGVGNEVAVEVSSVQGISIAVPFEIRLARFIALQPELGVVDKGSKTGDVAGVNYSDFRVRYAELPILVKAGAPVKKLRFDAIVGPCIGAVISGEYRTYEHDTNGNAVEQEGDLEVGTGYLALRRMDFSMVAGLEASYEFGRSTVYLDGRYMHSFLDALEGGILFRDSNGNSIGSGSVYNRAFAVQLGFLFRLGKDKSATSSN